MSPLNSEEKQDIEAIKEQTKGVSWNVYVWTVALFTGIVGFLYANDMRLSGKLDSQNVQYQQIQVQLAQLNTNVAWIMDAIKK